MNKQMDKQMTYIIPLVDELNALVSAYAKRIKENEKDLSNFNFGLLCAATTCLTTTVFKLTKDEKSAYIILEDINYLINRQIEEFYCEVSNGNIKKRS